MSFSCFFRFFISFALAFHPTNASSRISQKYAVSCSIVQNSYRTRRSILSSSSPSITSSSYNLQNRRNSWSQKRSSPTFLASNKKSQKKEEGSSESPTDMNSTTAAGSPENNQVPTYADLGPVGKAVAGTIEITVSTLMEWVSGFTGGYVLGTVTDVPRLLFRSTTANVAKDGLKSAMVNPLSKEIPQRFLRMHTKSKSWAMKWAGISAVFGGSRVAAKVLRNGKEDEWTSILSSAAAGAYFAKNEGPQAMLRSAAMYGGFVYIFSRGQTSGKKEVFQYDDRYIEEANPAY